ncbi:MAG: sensor domain-containing diguanylate cyclase [Aquificae bacterium]|nr:sensor domain-containing diguanylate cyclase [Aquificota bacterium]
MRCEEKIEKLLTIIEKVANKEYEKDNWRGILDMVTELFEADGAAIGEVRGDYLYYTKVSSSVAEAGLFDPEEFKVPVWWSAFEEALGKGYIIVNDYQNYERSVDAWKRTGLRAKVVAILGDKDPFGSLSVGRLSPGKPFTEEDGKILRSLAFIFSFIVREEIEKRRLMEKAIKDHLTQLYNRFYLEETGSRELERSQRYGFPVSLILFDLDDFKRINDEFGHQAGDTVLIRFAQVLRSSVRGTDIPARYGGEEFVLLLPHTHKEEAITVAERVRQRFSKVRFRFGETPVQLTVSAGVSSCEGGRCTLEELIEQADKAMYEAKRKGKNRVEVFSYKEIN